MKPRLKKAINYVTLGVDLDTSRVIHVTEGKGKATLKSIQKHLETKGVEKEQVNKSAWICRRHL